MGRPKTEHGKYGELKTAWVRARVTPSAKDGLESVAESLSISLAELLERMGRGEVGLTASLGESSLN